MDSSSNFWAPLLKAELHRTIASLQQLTETPSEPRTYHVGVEPESRTHTLSVEDELRTANSIAFLAHSKEGGKFVSTVTLREYPERLRLVLAGNTTPSSNVLEELAKLTACLSRLSKENSSKYAVREELLNMVLQLSSNRILGRLRPSWVAKPQYFRLPQSSLRDRLWSRILTMRAALPFSAQIKLLLERLEKLANTLKLVEHPMETNALQNALKMIVLDCAQVARLGSTNSVEEHLKFLGAQVRLAESPEIRQVDKLARYFFASRDLARIARNPSHRRLFGHIEIVALQSPPGLARPGSAQHCFVHAEIQQIFHLEQKPHTPAPRAIGCSKSACYLCDLFIRTHRGLVVSHTHGRLYEKWTLPDVGWMTATQTDRFQCIVQNMAREMRGTIQRLKGGGRFISSYPLESRACLPLSSSANSSLVERGKEVEEEVHERRHINAVDALLPRRYSWPFVLPSSIKITELDLPWHRYTRMGQGPLHVQVDRLSLHIDFASTATGLLSICPRQHGSPDESNILKALDIPVDSDLPVRGSRASRKVAFGITLDATRIIQVEFVWEAPSY